MPIPNQQWTYIIVDTDRGMIQGTDDEKEAITYASSDEFFVINVKTVQWLMDDVNTVNIPPVSQNN